MTEREIAERLASHIRDYATILDLHADDSRDYANCKGCRQRVNDCFYGCCHECLRRIAAALESKPAEEGR